MKVSPCQQIQATLACDNVDQSEEILAGPDCFAARKSIPALHYSVDYIVLSFRLMHSIVEL